MRENKLTLEKINDKGMEGRKSNGIATTGVLEPTTMKLPG
jgi:hypothetical protein